MSYVIDAGPFFVSVKSGHQVIATFGRMGVVIKTTDAHRPLPDRDGKPSIADWKMFKLEVFRLFGVNLPEDYQPKWLTEE